PLFAASLLFMALALMVVLVVKMPQLPELWHMGDLKGWTASNGEDFGLLGLGAFFKKNPLFPCLFITIACGAISGFHATQSPLMARCLKSERHARAIFYGAMITEGIVALIWAAVSSYFFYYGGWREVVPEETVNAFLAQAGAADGRSLIQYFSAPDVVKLVCSGWLGIAGGILAILGVVAAPITSGDTAFRSARLIIADFLHLSQKRPMNRLYVGVPMFAAAMLLLLWQVGNPDGFNTLWQYFGWSNQSITVFTLWAMTVYLARNGRNYVITLIPAVFMTVVCTVFFVVSPLTLGLSTSLTPWVTVAVVLISFSWFFAWLRKNKPRISK
ncbi:MAG: carbon starvation protein A, partial [Muribaculaceae bacterium]|nr:carbon starvation protein A [Muribaculaceae bacterium]